MARSKREKPGTDFSDQKVQVKLKRIFGIRPGIYLTFIYALLLLFILFMLFFYRGIRDRGTYLFVNTFPPGAAVLVDGAYAGSTPCEVLVKKGKRTITVEKPFFKTMVKENFFRGPIFATLFFRPKKLLSLHLILEDTPGLVAHALQDFAANPHIPEILEETVWAAHNQSDRSVKDNLLYFLDKSKYFITNSFQLNALIYALSTLTSNVHIFTPDSLINMVYKIINNNEKYDNFPFWILITLPEDTARRLTATPWFSRIYSRYIRSCKKEMQENAGTASFFYTPGRTEYTISGTVFRSVPGGTLMQGKFDDNAISHLLAHPVHIEPFFISETEVTNKTFKDFLDENPQWRKSNLEKLLKDNLVSENYLYEWNGDIFPGGEEDMPIVNVSFHAAEAFCRWFNQKAASFLPGYEARLPYETEWEWAARGGLKGKDYPMGDRAGSACFFQKGISGPKNTGSSQPNGFGIKDMAGNVWEWCKDWYSPIKYLFSSLQAHRNDFQSEEYIPLGAEKVVRGGSWANEKELVKLYTRGSQPPSWCTPYLGFRIVLSRF